MNPSETDNRVVEWRLSRERVLLTWVPVVALALTTLSALLQAADPAPHPEVHDKVFLAIAATLWTIMTTVIFALTVRTRVRLISGGVEIRQLRTRLVPLDTISVVELDRYSAHRHIKIGLTDGSSTTLPTPTRGLRKPSDSTRSDAVSLIKARC